MVTKTEKKEEPQDDVKRTYTTDEAQLRLVNLIYDTDEAHILSLTRIRTSREAFLHATQITREAALLKSRDPVTTPLSKVWRHAYLLLARSIDMHAFNMAVGLARGQAEAEADAASEEAEL